MEYGQIRDRLEEERGQANKIGSEVSFEDFGKWCHNLDAFDVEGAVIRVDGTDFDKVHYGELAEAARRFFGSFLIFPAYLNHKPSPLWYHRNSPSIIANFSRLCQKTN